MITVGAELQPFDKHPANPAYLEQGAQNLVDAGAQSLQNGENTREAYSPAITAVTGDPANAVAAATDPVIARSRASSGSLVWAGVTTKYWSGQVKEFNRKVDIILANLSIEQDKIQTAAQNANNATVAAGGTPDLAASQAATDLAMKAAVELAKEEWRKANIEHIINGGVQAANMLRQGPTEGNQQLARETGSMPDIDQGPWAELAKRYGARTTFPENSGLLAQTIWGIGTALTGGAAAADASRLLLGQFMPGGMSDLSPLERYRALGSNKSFMPKTLGNSRALGVAEGFLDRVTFLGASTAAAGGAVEQWDRDQGRTDLSEHDREGRAATRAAINGTSAYWGAKAGISAGQWLGSATKSPVVGAVGVNAGVWLGGLGGSWVGNGVSDAVIGTSDAVDSVKDWINGD